MSSKDTRDEPGLKNGKLNRRNMLLAGSTLAAVSTLSSTPSSPEQAGALGAYSNSAIAMMPPGQAVPASEQDRVLGIKIARAMLSGPRGITKDATVAEMGADGNLIILRQGTNDSICFAADSLFRLARAFGFDGYNTQLLLDASEGGIRKEIRKSASDQHARTAVRSHGPLVRDGGKAAYGVLRRNPVGRFEARHSRRATWFARASGAP